MKIGIAICFEQRSMRPLQIANKAGVSKKFEKKTRKMGAANMKVKRRKGAVKVEEE